MGSPLSLVGNGRERNVLASYDKDRDTFVFMQLPTGESGVHQDGQWVVAIENGWYTVEIQAGDPTRFGDHYVIHANSVLMLDYTFPLGSPNITVGLYAVQVTDQRLRVSAVGGDNAAIDTISIQPLAANLITAAQLTASAVSSLFQTVVLTAQTQLSATAVVTQYAAATISATLVVSGTAGPVSIAAGGFVARTRLTGTGLAVVVLTGATALTARVRLQAGPIVFKTGQASLIFRAQLTATAGIVQSAAATLSTVSTLTGSVLKVQPAGGTIRTLVVVTATAAIVVPAGGRLSAVGVLSSTPPLIIKPGIANLVQNLTLVGTGSETNQAVAVLTTWAILEATGESLETLGGTLHVSVEELAVFDLSVSAAYELDVRVEEP